VHDGTQHFAYPAWGVVNGPNEFCNVDGAFGCALALRVSGLAATNINRTRGARTKDVVVDGDPSARKDDG
jgi:acyl-coenzyme A thioesterase PaaI-like protein